MKTNYHPLLAILIAFVLILSALSLISLNIYMYLDTKEQLEITEEKQPVFIWNDDEESMPVDGTPVMLQYTEGDTVYLGPIEIDTSEYQFTITDDSMTVTDFGRHVGTVKVEGQLEQLLIKDNE